MNYCRAVIFIGFLCLCSAGSGCSDNTQPSGADAGASDTQDLETSDGHLDAEDVVEVDSSDAVDGDSGGEDEQCQINCEVKFSCADGVVYDHPWRVSCSGGQQACSDSSQITEVYQCEEGCALFENYWSWPIVEQASEMCEENRPRSVGEPCEEDADCAPTDHDSSGNPLECDSESGTCVDPLVPDYQAYCDIPTGELASGDGFVEAAGSGFTGCGDSSYCVVEKDANQVCQSCSTPCETAADCPSGSTCQAVSELGGSDSVMLCVPREGPLYGDYVECRSVE